MNLGRRTLSIETLISEDRTMRDIKSDWKLWSNAERVSAVALLFAICIVAASSLAYAAGA